ncbi:MAG TPA: DUF192 domain-containing protein [Bacillales bacterium]|nr:DUF192 domain-containing protein [Bacillales bacterium]
MDRLKGLVNRSTGCVLAETVEEAHTFGKRLTGLMFRRAIPERYAMHLKPCRSIHTFFMRFPIDVLYLDAGRHIVAMQENLGTGKIGKSVRGAESVVELPAGQIRESGTRVGQVLHFG